jgi:hypothetical protein
MIKAMLIIYTQDFMPLDKPSILPLGPKVIEYRELINKLHSCTCLTLDIGLTRFLPLRSRLSNVKIPT